MNLRTKIAWYGRNLLNLTIASIRIFFFCLVKPQRSKKLFFSFFSIINEFYQFSYGQLLKFETTSTYKKLQHQLVFASSNYFNFDENVARPQEAQVLATLTKYFSPKTVFEIGTYNGFTTLHFAYNTEASTKIFTLDLPPQTSVAATHDTSKYSYDDYLVVKLSQQNIDNRIYRGHELTSKIHDLFGNSMNFDFSPYHGKIDMIYIDGSHAFKYVASDTENAFKMLSPDGVIIWHDYDYIIHRDVFKYLNQLSKTHKIYHVPNTRFAIYGKNI